MSFVVAATYVAKDGETDTVLGHLQTMVGHTRAEPGCITYRLHRSVEDPNALFLYEEYVDAAAFEAHRAAPYFEQIAMSEIWPRLASRSVVRAEPLD